jgi:hypothetical protein
MEYVGMPSPNPTIDTKNKLFYNILLMMWDTTRFLFHQFSLQTSTCHSKQMIPTFPNKNTKPTASSLHPCSTQHTRNEFCLFSQTLPVLLVPRLRPKAKKRPPAQTLRRSSCPKERQASRYEHQSCHAHTPIVRNVFIHNILPSDDVHKHESSLQIYPCCDATTVRNKE